MPSLKSGLRPLGTLSWICSLIGVSVLDADTDDGCAAAGGDLRLFRMPVLCEQKNTRF